MRIGVPTEVKDNEYRVGMVPSGVADLTLDGHEILVQKGAGAGSGFSDDEYVAAGAQMVAAAEDVWSGAEMVVKVKEPYGPDIERIQPGRILFTYLHLA